MFCIVAIALLGAAVAEAQIFSPYLPMSMYDTRAVHPLGLSMLRPDIFSIAPRVILPADITPKFILPTDIYAQSILPKPVEDTEEVKKAKIDFAEAYKKALLIKDEEVKEVKEEDKEVKEDRKKRDLTSVMPLTMPLMSTMHTMPMMPIGMRSIYPAASYMAHYRYY